MLSPSTMASEPEPADAGGAPLYSLLTTFTYF